MNKLLLIITALLLTITACKKEDNAEENNIRFCPNIYAQYSYENNGDTAYCWVPNAFSANGDGINDVFAVYKHNIAALSFTIKDGNTIVYQTDSMWAHWDGYVNGEVTYKNYDYTINGQDILGNIFNLTGTVSVIGSQGEIGYQWMDGTVNCDSCRFPAQWDGMKYDPTLPSGEFMTSLCEE